MHRSHAAPAVERKSVAHVVISAEPQILDEEAWEEAIDDSGVDTDLMCHSQWRASGSDFGDLD